VVICSQAVAAMVDAVDVTLLLAPVPRLAFARITAALFAPPAPTGRHRTAVVHPTAVVHDTAYLGAHTVVGADCEVGPGTVLHAGVILHERVRVGAHVTIHSGSVLGADGFGYHRNESGVLERLPHFGGVRIEDHVEIGANACIDRGTLDDTVVRARARIDNLVHIAHNADVGEDAAVIAHAMVAGSARIGPRAWIAPGALIRDGGLTIGADAVVGLGAVVLRSVPAGSTVVGNPARALEAKPGGAAPRPSSG
jgi:UDP-3-O-[3-hydroxymyristoyl] glucosamine N-acyltransferase